jgi:6-pyruvoyl-tetrahydropterin synthase
VSRLGVARRYTFCAEHHVPGLAEPWSRPHAHGYTVEVEATGEPKGEAMMIVDTDAIDAAWAELAPADGSDLNAGYDHTTVEWLASYWLAELRGRVPEVSRVTVWEDETRWGRAVAA